MKFIKWSFIAFFCIAVIAMIVGLFMKKDYHIERKVVINASKDKVFDYIKHLKNQNNYSYWFKQDPSMIMDYKGEDTKVGFVLYWDGNDKAGKGEQEIKSIIDGVRLDFEIRFKEPIEMTNSAYMITDALENGQTKVTWGFEGKLSYPMNIMMPFVDFDKMLGGQLQTSLNDLKTIMERIPLE